MDDGFAAILKLLSLSLLIYIQTGLMSSYLTDTVFAYFPVLKPELDGR